jgi:hypothetical protein
MLSNMKTSIFKFADLSWDSLAKIKKWFRQDIVRDGFNLQSFRNNPSLKVVEVHNSVGETIALFPIEPCFVVNQIVNPQATPIEASVAGDNADRALAKLAQQEGITRFLIICPTNSPTQPDERWVRIIERTVPQVTATQSVDCAKQSTTAYIN